MMDREVEMEDIQRFHKLTAEASQILKDIPFIIIATAKVRNADQAWLHIGANMTGDEMTNSLREFFLQSPEVLKIARAALDEAEKRNSTRADNDIESMKSTIIDEILTRTGTKVNADDIDLIAEIGPNGEGLADAIDRLSDIVSGEASDDVIKEVMNIINKDDKEAGEQE